MCSEFLYYFSSTVVVSFMRLLVFVVMRVFYVTGTVLGDYYARAFYTIRMSS